MTKNEYKAVSAIRSIFFSIYMENRYDRALFSVLNTLTKEFTKKYKGKLVKINSSIIGVHKSKITEYEITIDECKFRTYAGFCGTEFGKRFILLPDEN